MLLQADADAIIRLAKTFVGVSAMPIPGGCDANYQLLGEGGEERFLFDVWRGTLKLSKVKFQSRGRSVVVLVRLDIDGAPHMNPDGEMVGGTHLHVYREGFEAKWAQEIPTELFTEPSNIRQTCTEFCRYCNITAVPFQETV